ncbi:MAG: tetratricopeptide repeat protein, partial [candidate division Zixibacteria bacterium]|nr:tetratricopeptide repeat protein [candidate division Zixibacteria bacterium]
GNNPEADGLTMVMPEIRLDLSIPWSEFVDTTDSYARHDQGRPLRPSEISSYWNDKGWKWVFEHPANFLALTGKRIVYLFSGFENSDQADIYRFSENSPILQTLIFDRGVKFPFGVVAPLALIGLLLAWPERRKLAPIYLFLLGYTPTIVLFLVTARHRLAVIVLFLIFAAFAFSRILDAMMERRREAIGLIAAFAVLLALLNLRPFDLGYDTSGQYHYQRGLVFEKQGRLDEAIGEYREALKYQPIPEAFNNLGYALARRDDFAGAYQAYQQGLRAKPNAADILANLGLLFLNVNQLDSAEHYLTRSRSVNPKLAQVYVNLAELYDRGGETARCEQAYRDGIAAVENYGPLYNGLANFLLKSNRGDEALAVLAAGTAAAPEYAIGHANFANLLFEKSDLRAARSAYAQALRLDPSLNQARLNLAVLFVRSNFPDSARVELETILRLDPNFAPARQLLEKIR